MNSTYRSVVSAAIFLTTISGAVPEAHAANETPLTFQFSETLHVRDQQTVVDKINGSLTEHVSSEGGVVRIDAAMPLDSDLKLDPATPIVITAGNFTLRTTLAADSNYHEGMRQANIALAAPTGSGNSSVFYGHVKIKWTNSRLSLHVDGNIPALSSVCAHDLILNPSRAAGGKVTVFTEGNSGETRATLTFGEIRATAHVVFHSKASGRSVNGGRYADPGLDWKYLKASPGELESGRRSAHETTIRVTGSDGA